MDECAFDKWFKSNDNYSNAKLAFEGEGIVMETKMKNPKLRWGGVPIVITSNVLPSVLHKPWKKDTEEMWQFENRKKNYEAFQTRIDFVKMEQSHDNKEKFTYTTEELAIFMHDYIK